MISLKTGLTYSIFFTLKKARKMTKWPNYLANSVSLRPNFSLIWHFKRPNGNFDHETSGTKKS